MKKSFGYIVPLRIKSQYPNCIKFGHNEIIIRYRDQIQNVDTRPQKVDADRSILGSWLKDEKKD